MVGEQLVRQNKLNGPLFISKKSRNYFSVEFKRIKSAETKFRLFGISTSIQNTSVRQIPFKNLAVFKGKHTHIIGPALENCY